MAVENLTATNANANLPVAAHGMADDLKFDASTIEISASASASSTYVMHKVPSGARLSAATSRVYWDDMATAGSPTLDIGVSGPSFTYDDDLLTQDLAIDATTTSGASMFLAKENYGKALWQLAGLTSDPGEVWNITAKIKDADVTTGGTLSTEVGYKTD